MRPSRRISAGVRSRRQMIQSTVLDVLVPSLGAWSAIAEVSILRTISIGETYRTWGEWAPHGFLKLSFEVSILVYGMLDGV